MFALLNDAGITSLRFDFLWSQIEPVQGEFHFEAMDRIVDEANRHGISVLGILCYGTPWATTRPVLIPGLSQVPPPDNPDHFRQYAAAVAAHFKGRVFRWEIWNEPNNGFRFWSPAIGGNPTEYARLLIAGYEGIKGDPADPGDGVCEECTVAFSGLSYPYCYEVLGIPGGLSFLDAAHRTALEELGTNLGNYYDVMAFHLYMYPPLELLIPAFYPPEVPAPLGYDPARETNREGDWLQLIADTRSVLAKYGLDSKPLWLTEFGWPTNVLWPGAGLPRGVSPEEQAAYVVRSALLSITAGVKHLYLFTYRDGPNHLLYQETAFGIVEYDPDYPETVMTPATKPAFHALRVMTGLVGHLHFRKDLRQELGLQASAYALRFATQGCPEERLTILWNIEGGEPVQVTLPVDKRAKIELLDMYGVPFATDDNKEESAGGLPLILSPAPIYVIERPVPAGGHSPRARVGGRRSGAPAYRSGEDLRGEDGFENPLPPMVPETHGGCFSPALWAKNYTASRTRMR
jgi:hypothetical protein